MSLQTWNYANLGPDVWNNIIPACAGRSQSPINIQTACTTYQPMAPFQFSSGYSLPQSFNLTNNGVTISANLATANSSSLILTGGGLDGNFTFLEFHLHWGENYGSGSEHEVNGVKYAGEIHFVHVNRELGRLAVLGFFIQSDQMTPTDANIFSTSVDILTSTEWGNYISGSRSIQQVNSSATYNFNLASLMGNNVARFWRYNGSLTNPPCTEGVIWTVFTTPILFSDNFLNSLRSNFLPQNDRHPQPLNNRIVYRNYPNETVSPTSEYNCCPRTGSEKSGANPIMNTNFFFILFVMNFH